MGFIQTAFAASQVLGLPAGLYLANRWDWHAPFMAIIGWRRRGGLIIALAHEAGGGASEAEAGAQRLWCIWSTPSPSRATRWPSS